MLTDEATIIQPETAPSTAQHVAYADPYDPGPHFADRIGVARIRFANDSRTPVNSARVGTGSQNVVVRVRVYGCTGSAAGVGDNWVDDVICAGW